VLIPSFYAIGPRTRSVTPIKISSDQNTRWRLDFLFTLIEYKNFLSPSFLDTQNLVKWIIIMTLHTCDSPYILHVDITAHQTYILNFVCSPTILPVSISTQHVHVLFIAQHIHVLFIIHHVFYKDMLSHSQRVAVINIQNSKI